MSNKKRKGAKMQLNEAQEKLKSLRFHINFVAHKMDAVIKLAGDGNIITKELEKIRKML